MITLTNDVIYGYDTDKTVNSASGKHHETTSIQPEEKECVSATDTQFINETVRTKCNSGVQSIVMEKKNNLLKMVAGSVAFRIKKKITISFKNVHPTSKYPSKQQE